MSRVFSVWELGVLNERGGQITAATRYLCALEQNCLSRDGMDPRTARFMQHLEFSEPDARVLSLMNPEERPQISDDFILSPVLFRHMRPLRSGSSFSMCLGSRRRKRRNFQKETAIHTVIEKARTEMAEGKKPDADHYLHAA